ncbi:YD repeat-containing protein [Sphingomonas leidyi]|uniref:YD repeat-containing protein n=1 Tax=Sphingomonas leidyi TaxID=68569 RepID=A0A7X5ZWX1_9SPHN|nr:RHS repeat protein [Sphingomonas leidyi]NIJ66660.1 YD repeat-containing protein [Sphingomonas leidyi]
MVAIFTGAGTGFERGSGSVLGGSGLLGSASFGRSGEQVFLNAANGNLLINRQDEFLVGRGPDAGVGRTYNSLGNQSDDNGDNWLQSTDRRVFGLTGTLNSWGSTIKRRSGDGSEISYGWDGTSYVATDGAGSFDRLSYNGSGWTWTDGDSRVTESYAAYGSYWRITSQSDTSGNSLTYGYTGDKLTTLTTANGETLTYVWSGNHISEVISGDGTATVYNYDSYGRLSQVAVQLSAGGGSFYSTWYSYVGATTLVSRIEQTDGSVLAIGYDGSNRVTSLAQTVAAGDTRTTSLYYGAGYTDVTDPTGTVTRLEYADGNFAPQLDGWAWGGVDRQPATIDGRAATRYTVQTQGGWSGISTGLVAAAGETISFALTLQASGSATSQALGLHGNIDAWGPNDASSARIVSGPGRLVQLAGGFWQVDGLSTTEGTRIEITRTFTQVQYVGAYFYADYPGGYRAGTSLIAADPELLRSATATDPYLMDQANWSYYDTARQSAGTLAGSAAYQYTIQPNATWPAIYQSLNATRAGDTFTYTVTLQGSGDSTATSVGLYGNVTIWGDNSWASARIISGPGSISQEVGGLFNITGLSTTTPTRIEIIRTYDRAETGGIYTYVDRPLGMRVGGSLVIAGPRLTQDIATERANQLTKITTGYGTAQARTVQFGYNANGDLTSVTDGLGNTTSYTYDANGNQLTATDRLGNVVTRTYSATNQLLTETRTGSDKDSAAAAHTTRYVYDSANRLRFTIGAEGDVTEYRYNGYGQKIYDIAYTGQVYDQSGWAEADLVAWRNALADPTAASHVEYLYHANGTISHIYRYAAAYAPGSPHVGEGYSYEVFSYDSAGRLITSTVAGQNSLVYAYDGLGRVVASTDLNGGTTSIVFNDAATQTVITLANGFVQTSTYNKAGELVSFTESGEAVAGGTASYAYDRNGRLRVMTDATGVKSYHVYDKAGRKVADIDAYGSVTEYQYDLNNRLIGTVRYENGIMGGAGAMATLGDPNNSLDMASIRPNPNGHDQWTWTVYDKEGRVIEAIEGDGSVTAYEYDGSGRLVKTTGYANKLSSGQLDAFKVNGPSAWLPAAHAKDSVARIFYDKDGRKIGALDGEGYLTRTIYDGSGRKVQEIAYANITSAALRASGSLQSLIDSAGTSANDRSTRYVHDGQDLLRYTIDALGHVTEYGYGSGAAATGLVRQTTRYAGTIGTLSSYSYASVKSAVAALASDPANRTGWAVYDNAGRLAYSIDATGAVVGYGYDIRGQVIRKVEYATLRPTASLPGKGDMDSWAASYPTANDRVTRYYYSARGELRYTVDAEGYVTGYIYDAEGRKVWEGRWGTPVAATDSWSIYTLATSVSGEVSARSYAYDAAGRITLTTDGEGGTRRYYYHANGLLAWDIVSEGSQDDSRTYYVYDAAGRKAAAYAAFGTAEQAITTYTYNGLGDLIAVSDPNAHTTSFEYDHAGRMVRQANAYGSPTVFEYNAFGEVTRMINARGFSTYSEYDQAGRVTSVVDALGNATTTRYTAFGEVASVTRGAAVTSFGYDKLGRAVTTTDAEGGVETSGYDAFGNRIRLVNKLGGITDYSYDRRGLLAEERVQAILDGSGNVVTAAFSRNRYEYDARGNVVHRIEAYGLAEQRDSWFEYDKANRLTSKWGEAVSVGLSQAMATPREYYRYDTRGNLVETIDANGARTLSYYDDLNRRIATVTPAGTAGTQGVLSTFAYDAAGNLTASRTWATLVALPGMAGGTPPGNPGGAYRETVNTYDALDRLKTSSVANQSVGYWNGSAYVYATDVTLETAYEYNVVGDLVRTTDSAGKSVYSYYDANSRKIAQVDQEGYLTRWALDAEGNVLGERRFASRATGVSSSSYTAPDIQTDDRLTEFAYDKMGRRTEERRYGVEAWSLNTANGQLSGASGTSLIQYVYNALGEVVRKVEATGDQTIYAYDNAGRLSLEMRQTFASPTGNVNPTVRYQYNGLGQLTVTRQGDYYVSGNDRISTNLYDGAGRLTGVSDALGQTRSYYYDAAGRKVGEYYTRELGNGGSLGAGTLVTEGISYQYDLAGNVVRQAINTIAGGSWSEVSSTQSAYDAFGAITARGTNGGWQEQFRYDTAGRLVASNAGDGVWRIHAYDKAGRQTLAIESNGSTDLSGMSQASAIGLIAGGTVTASATVYDARGQAVQAVQVQRQTAVGGGTQNIATARGYTAFGELAWETDAYGRQTDYSYNTMGRVTQIQRPSVSVTAENGTVSSTRPTERMFYDIGGRLIGTQDANSVQTGSGVKTTRQLLAGTGYGDGAALVVKEWHPDGGVVANSYDVFGDQVDSWDALNRHTSMAYDKLGRLTQVTRPATAAGTLVQSYAYDVLGNRIGAWNNAVGYAGRERTQYDALGRITLQMAFGGDTTTTSYGWDGAMATSGLGTFGGWVQTTSTDADRASASYGIHAAVQRVDIFGRVVARSDKGGQAYGYQYDRAARIVAETSTLDGAPARNLVYSYYNTGQIRQVLSGDVPVVNTSWNRKVASYEYDLLGQLTRETLVSEVAEFKEERYVWVLAPGQSPDTPEGEGQGYWDFIPASYIVRTGMWQDGRAEYDAAGRITRYRDVYAPGVDAVDKSWTYDAAGNVRSIATSYLPVQASGLLATTATSQAYWYRYDSMNRVVTTKGVFVGAAGSGAIQRGGAGTDVTYDAAGQRATAQTGSNAQEAYAYDAVGQLGSVVIGGTTRAQTSYDLLGRVSSYAEYDGWGVGVHSRYDIVYDPRGLVLAEKSSTRQGSDTLYTHTVNYYSATGVGSAGPAISWSGQAGSASGSLLYYSETKNWKNGGTPVYGGPGSYSQADLDYADSYTSQSYAWRDGAQQTLVQLTNRDGTSSSSYSYDRDGALTGVAINGGSRPRAILYRTDLQGQVILRGETDLIWGNNEPLTRTYMFGGRQMGVVSNDGTANVDYAAAIAARTAAPGNGTFRNGATNATIFADFDANFTALNGGTVGGASSYSASAGETLQSIAAQLWGDSNLWYRLAEANPGFGAGGAVPAGTTLTVPGGVVGSHHDATTFRPYDPAEAIGNTSPNTPAPPKRNSCGALGAILVAAIAVAVTTLVTAGATALVSGQSFSAVLGAMTGGAAVANVSMAAWVGGGAIGGAVGSAASQGFGVATGMQDKFNWKGVALAGVSGAVGGYFQGLGNSAGLAVDTLERSGVTLTGQVVQDAIRAQLGPVGGFLTGGGIAGAAARGVLSNVVTQGIGVATRLQSKFDFAGIAAAGLGAAAVGSIKTQGFAGKMLRNAAGGLANAASRSLIDGTDFGDNILAALPDIIGQTIGGALADRAAGMGKRTTYDRPENLLPEEIYNSTPAPVVAPGLAVTYQTGNEGALGIQISDEVGIFSDAVYRPGIDDPLFWDASVQGQGLASRHNMTNVPSIIQGLTESRTVATIERMIANLAPGATLSPALALILAKASNLDPYNPLFVGGGGEEGTGLTTTVRDYAALYPVTKGLSKDANFAGWPQTGRIRNYIEVTRALSLPTTLIGHSYGGNAVFEGGLYAASRNLRIDYLVTVDPVDGSGWISRHSVTQAQTVKSTSARWVDVRSTTSDDWTTQWGSNGRNDFIKNLGKPMRREVQAVSAPYFYETSKWDHAGFVQMFEAYAKGYMIKLYK